MSQRPPPNTDMLKPVGHVVLSFPSAQQADDARRALAGAGARGHTLQALDSGEMRAQLDDGLQAASPLASLGREVDLARAQRELAERGYHFLVVHVDDDELARAVAEQARGFGAERALYYGHLIIEELIEIDDAPPGRGVDNPAPEELARSPLRGRA